MQEKIFKEQAIQQTNLPLLLKNGNASWQCPSNIAIVKYWGKKEIQLPRNPNLSFTLSSSHTTTSLSYEKRASDSNSISMEFLFEGVQNPSFEGRIRTLLTSLLPYFPFLSLYKLHIQSSNSFPHSSGIASSASAMSALAMCLCTMEAEVLGLEINQNSFLQKSSFIARLGSGSACRSVYPYAALWGKMDSVSNSSDEYAIDMQDILHPSFSNVCDTIFIVSEAVKKVSSSAGHNLMNNNPYANIRYAVATKRLSRLLDILKAGDWEAFGVLAEHEALDLHALMMSSSPSYILMQAATISLIQRIRSIRESTGLPMYFTLDAGPNVHLLYPQEVEKQVKDIIEVDLAEMAPRRIFDKMGDGPVRC